jgi:hypothetical protein
MSLQNSTIVIEDTAASVIVTESESLILSTEETVDLITVFTQGPQGPQGPAGENFIGGLPIEMSNILDGDLITVLENKWVNVKRETISDGGNF